MESSDENESVTVMTEPQIWTMIGAVVALMFGLLSAVSTLFVRVLRAEIGGVRSEIDGMRTGLGGELDALRTGVAAEINGLHTGVTAEINGLRTEMVARFETVDARFDAVNTRIDAVETRIEGLDLDVRALVKHTFGLDRG